MRNHLPDSTSTTPATRRPLPCSGGILRVNLKAYLDGETSALRGWLVRRHLAGCTNCREDLRWLHRLGEDMKDIESIRPRPELRARILASLPSAPPAEGIRVVRTRAEPARPLWALPRLALGSTLAVLLAVSGVYALTHRHGSNSAAGFSKPEVAVRNAGTSPQSSDSVSMEKRVPDATEVATYAPEEDPNNALADRLFRERMAEMEHEKQVSGEDDWHRLLTQARIAARKTNKSPNSEMAVALTVADIASTRANIAAWALRSGAKPIAAAKPSPGAQASDSALELQGRVVTFSLPAQHGPAFLVALRQLGPISAIPAGIDVATTMSIKAEAHKVYVATVDGQRHVIPAIPVSPDRLPASDTMIAATSKHPATGRILLLTVLLQSSARN